MSDIKIVLPRPTDGKVVLKKLLKVAQLLDMDMEEEETFDDVICPENGWLKKVYSRTRAKFYVEENGLLFRYKKLLGFVWVQKDSKSYNLLFNRGWDYKNDKKFQEHMKELADFLYSTYRKK